MHLRVLAAPWQLDEHGTLLCSLPGTANLLVPWSGPGIGKFLVPISLSMDWVDPQMTTETDICGGEMDPVKLSRTYAEDPSEWQLLFF